MNESIDTQRGDQPNTRNVSEDAQDLINADDLLTLQTDGKAPYIIDVRPDDQYEEGHIPGAIHIPRADIAQRVPEIPKNQPIVLYCNMHYPGESGSERGAKQLRDLKYNARALAGGFPEWKIKGYPIERGK